MLSTILSLLSGPLVSAIFPQVVEIIKKWQDKKITEIEAKQAIALALISSSKEVEVAHADMMAKTYSTFMGVVERNKFVAWIWGIVTIGEFLVLLWHQIGIPYLVFYMHQHGDLMFRYPSSGATVEWAYALLGGLLGLGAIALKSSTTAISADKIKAFITK